MSVTGDMLDENYAHGFEAGVARERAKVIAWIRSQYRNPSTTAGTILSCLADSIADGDHDPKPTKLEAPHE